VESRIVDPHFSDAVVNLLPQLPTAFKRYNPPRIQNHRIAGRRIPASACLFVLDTEFSEPADQDILTIGQGSLDDFEELLDQIDALAFRKSEFLLNDFDKVRFGEGHTGILCACVVGIG
jgi:hypothetical protein